MNAVRDDIGNKINDPRTADTDTRRDVDKDGKKMENLIMVLTINSALASAFHRMRPLRRLRTYRNLINNIRNIYRRLK